MPSFKTIKLQSKDGNECVFDLNLNDAAFMDDNLEIEVKGKYRKSNKDKWHEEVFTLQLNTSENKIFVMYRDEPVGEVDLNQFGENLDDIFNNEDIDDRWERIRELISDYGEGIEAAIESIPVPDPIFGCLIRAGISTTIGQLLECYPRTRLAKSFSQKIIPMLQCLGVNSLVMAGRFTMRTLKCAATGGWNIV
jgi:hypothetical protein